MRMRGSLQILTGMKEAVYTSSCSHARTPEVISDTVERGTMILLCNNTCTHHAAWLELSWRHQRRAGHCTRGRASATAAHRGARGQRRQDAGKVEELHEQLQAALAVPLPAGAAQRLRRHCSLPVACAAQHTIHYRLHSSITSLSLGVLFILPVLHLAITSVQCCHLHDSRRGKSGSSDRP